jgi:hypothetical protein
MLPQKLGQEDFTINDVQLQKKWKHARDFGISENWNTANARLFREALTKFIQENPEVIKEQISYNNQPHIMYFDPCNQLQVLTDHSGNFISGWRLSDSAFFNVVMRERLGGR